MKLDRFIEIRKYILKYLPKNSCVSSTRFLIEISQEKLQPLPVYLLAILEGKVSLVGRPGPEIESEAEWKGHLVAVSETELYDLSLDQVDGLQADIFKITDEFWNGVPLIVKQNNNLLVYWIDEHSPSPLETKAWLELWKKPYEDYLKGAF